LKILSGSAVFQLFCRSIIGIMADDIRRIGCKVKLEKREGRAARWRGVPQFHAPFGRIPEFGY
jgi:hypothetical protein